MRTVLYPAIALMNRLSFGMKFSLISVLFFVPMLVTNFYLVRDSYRQFLNTRSELQSLQPFQAAVALRRDLQAYGDLQQINVALGQARRSDDLDARIAGLHKQLVAAIAALQPPSTDTEQLAEFNTRRDELQATLKAVETEGSLQSKAGIATQLLNSVQLFNKLLASQAGLSQDDSRAVRQMAELVTSVTPQVAETLGRGRVIGSAALGQGFLNSDSSTRFDDVLQSVEKLHADYGLKLRDALAAVSASDAALGAAAERSQASLKSLGQLFEDKVVMADSLDTPWAQFYDQVSQGIAQTYQFEDQVLAHVTGELQQRLASKQLQMLLLSSTLLVLFLAIGYLYGAFYVSTRGTLKSLGRMMERVAAGDMTVNFQAQSRDELGELGQAFNDTVRRIHDLIEQVGHTVAEVERQTVRVENVSTLSNQAVAGQRDQIDQVATAMNQMAATAQEVARSAAAAVGSAQSVNDETVSGRALVESQLGSIQRLAGEIDRSVEAINRLAADSASISRVLDVIKGVAEQTNLLALNAAIEAARAGEQGRGFAVVADEVRTLARRTQQSTEEIEQMIDRLQNGVGAAVQAMGSSHRTADGTVSQSAQVQVALDNILGAVGMIVDQNQQIAAAAEQQTTVVHDIDQNIVQINQAGERTAEGANETERVSRELSGQVVELKRLIGAFRV
ncbi:MAG: Methyl-accepting chemotaxis protein McpA [Pseudomonas citronellolis]|nr:MAG: Methyl-accepting chemotaxis protein McpA [Pseudomonas citronellolis]